MRKIHMTLQGKGGVGKSLVAALLAQRYHLDGKGEEVVCVDTDPVNQTLSGYRALQARKLVLMEEGGEIVSRNFDNLMEWLLVEDRDFVIDNGASSFVPLVNYLVENNAIDTLTEAGKQVIIHTVITGGQAFVDTIKGFDALMRVVPEGAAVVVWLNEFFGTVEHAGKTFEQMPGYEKYRSRINALVRIPKQTRSTFGLDMEMLLQRRLTFAEARQDPQFTLMAKQRLAMMSRTLMAQLEPVV